MSDLQILTVFGDSLVSLRLANINRSAFLRWLGMPVPHQVPILVVMPEETPDPELGDRAMKLADHVADLGYSRVDVIRANKLPRPKPPTIPEDRPGCPQCRERDQVVMPHEDDLIRKMFGQTFCRRCKGPFFRLKPAKLPPHDF